MTIIFINFFLISLYIINFDLPGSSILLKLLYIFLFFILISSIFYVIDKKKEFFFKFNIVIFSTIFSFIIIEFFFHLNPKLIPKDIGIWLNKDKDKKKSFETEVLDHNPFIKFKPNQRIKLRFYRGNAKQFEYEWLTDLRGFKNSKEISKLNKFKILAIGDSYTEGYGVKIEDTFTSILSKKGYPAYNMGVQGYSITQSKGILKNYTQEINAEIIFCLYLRGSSYRENYFENDKLKNVNKFTGGVANQFEADQNPEIREQAKYLTSALWLSTKFIRNNLKDFFKKRNFLDKRFNAYPNINYSGFERKKPEIKSWSLLKDNLIEIKKISSKKNSIFILGYIDNRTLNYYQRATGKKPHPSHFYERDELKKFSKKNNIIFIDFGEVIRNYMTNLPSDFTKKDFPYLEVDGHLSKVGNQLIANKIISKIKELSY